MLLEEGFPYVNIKGEVSNLSIPGSGHCYFILKDEEAQVRAVLFQGQRARAGYTPKEGEEVIVSGRPTVYKPRGDLQIIVDRIDPYGMGMLDRAFEELKRRLHAEGLFDPALKKPLPEFPKRTFVITSPTGAAIRDFLKTARQRLVTGQIILCPTRVQGQRADSEMVEALNAIEALAQEGDVVVITRGGGSKEDLWTYNSEPLARRIAATKIPVVSAVGHEIDVTIADLVADKRAATPTAAAQTIFPERPEYRERLSHLRSRMSRNLGHLLSLYRNNLDAVLNRLKDPLTRVLEKRILVDELLYRMERCVGQAFHLRARRLKDLDSTLLRRIESILYKKGEGLKRATNRLEVLSPLRVLSRGYSVVMKEDGSVVKVSEGVSIGERLTIRPYRGKIICKVEEAS